MFPILALGFTLSMLARTAASATVRAYHLPVDLRTFIVTSRPRAAAGLMLWSRHGGPRGLAMAFTAIASASFVFAALLGGAVGSRYGRRMAAGLVFCMLGDVLGPGDFMFGLYAFLVAHVGVTGAFLAQGVDRRNLFVSAAASVVASVIVHTVWLGPHVPQGEQPQVIAYTAVITGMLVFAGATPHFVGKRTAVAGAILFYLSDVFVANWRYVDTGRWNAFVCYPLYYTACVLLALSILAARRASIRPANRYRSRIATALDQNRAHRAKPVRHGQGHHGRGVILHAPVRRRRPRSGRSAILQGTVR